MRAKRSHRPWTEAEITRLIELRETETPLLEIARRLGRSVMAVENRSGKLIAVGRTEPYIVEEQSAQPEPVNGTDHNLPPAADLRRREIKAFQQHYRRHVGDCGAELGRFLEKFHAVHA